MHTHAYTNQYNVSNSSYEYKWNPKLKFNFNSIFRQTFTEKGQMVVRFSLVRLAQIQRDSEISWVNYSEKQDQACIPELMNLKWKLVEKGKVVERNANVKVGVYK